MKRLLVVVTALMLLSVPVMAQNKGAKAAAGKSVNDKGTFNLQVGIGFGSDATLLAYGTVFTALGGYVIPPITVAGNWGINDLFSVGFTAGVYGWGYNGSGSSYSDTWLLVGPRGNFHFNRWIGVRNLDVYVGLTLGLYLNIVSGSWAGYSTFGAGTYARFMFNGHVGVKYYFTDVIGIWAEAGWGYSVFSAGVVFRF